MTDLTGMPDEVAAHAAVFAGLERACVALRGSDEPTRPGSSRMFGAPDLPPGAAWPVDDAGAPLPFAFQVNLTDVAEQFPGRVPLPERSGLLQFFTTFVAGDGGDWADGEFGPDGGANRVLLRRELTGLAPVEPPVASAGDARELRLEAAVDLPNILELQLERPGYAAAYDLLVDDDDLAEAYSDWNDGGRLQVGGYPSWLQDAGYATAVMQERGLYYADLYDGSGQEVDPALVEELRREGARWGLVLQTPSLVGDDGTFYFLAPPDGTGRFDLDRVRFVYQCT